MKITRTEIFINTCRDYLSTEDKTDLIYILRNYIRLLKKDNYFHIMLCLGLKAKYTSTIPYEKRIKHELIALLNAINTDMNYTKLENDVFSKLLKILRNKNISENNLQEAYKTFSSLIFQGDMRKDYLESCINKFDTYLYAINGCKNIDITDYDPTYLVNAKEKVKELTKS